MPEREVRYCTTEDGVRIAYCVEGEGNTTILALPVFNETFSLDHLMPVYKQFYRELGAGRRVIRFDWRGAGLSDMVPHADWRAANDRDVEAVARSAGAEKFVLWTSTTSGPSAIQFAANHPDLVSHLILYGTYAATADAFSESLFAGLVALAAADWQMASQAIADMNGRKEFPEEAGQLGEWYYRSGSSERFRVRAQTGGVDVSALLSDVHTPTLILHRIADPTIPLSAGQKLAAGIPGARFVPLEGQGHLFCLGDYGAILHAVDTFLADRTSEDAATADERQSAFRTVLFTDIVAHTEMMQRLGDEQGRAVLREHERITREVLKQHAGVEVKTMGDGFMASFGSVTKAVECAIALHRAFAAWSAQGEHVGSPLQIRVGLNAGEPIEEEGDLFGSTVILASRIAAQAGPGEILVPDTIRGLASGKGFLFADRGEVIPKGFEDPVRLYEVRWREESS